MTSVSIFENYDPKSWEKFCETMLRHHYGQRNFFPVPDEDGGDLGIEFYTSCGTIFQCYFPKLEYDLKTRKNNIKKKITQDLGKLKKNEAKITKLLNGIIVKQWILLTPKYDSKEISLHCSKKTNDTKKKEIGFIDNEKFIVKVETDEIFPVSRNYALSANLRQIDIDVPVVSEEDHATWQGHEGNAKFVDNINRKTEVLHNKANKRFREKIISKYIQMDYFLDSLRRDHPDLASLIKNCADAQLENIEDEAIFSDEDVGLKYAQYIRESNKKYFAKFEKEFSDKNQQLLSIGYMAKWLAECDLKFIIDKDED